MYRHILLAFEQKIACSETSDAEEEAVVDTEDKMEQDSDFPPKKADPNDLSEYKLEEYDKEEAGAFPINMIQAGLIFALETGIFSNIKGLTYYKSTEDDPYITLKDVCFILDVFVFPMANLSILGG